MSKPKKNLEVKDATDTTNNIENTDHTTKIDNKMQEESNPVKDFMFEYIKNSEKKLEQYILEKKFERMQNWNEHETFSILPVIFRLKSFFPEKARRRSSKPSPSGRTARVKMSRRCADSRRTMSRLLKSVRTDWPRRTNRAIRTSLCFTTVRLFLSPWFDRQLRWSAISIPRLRRRRKSTS